MGRRRWETAGSRLDRSPIPACVAADLLLVQKAKGRVLQAPDRKERGLPILRPLQPLLGEFVDPPLLGGREIPRSGELLLKSWVGVANEGLRVELGELPFAEEGRRGTSISVGATEVLRLCVEMVVVPEAFGDRNVPRPPARPGQRRVDQHPELV